MPTDARNLSCWGALMLATALVSFPIAASAQSAQRQAQQQAYGYAMRCFVANGIAVGDWREANKPAEMAEQEAKARRSFDTAVKLGNVLGYSGTRMDQDFGLAQAQELPKLMTNRGYFQQTVSTCKTLGLM